MEIVLGILAVTVVLIVTEVVRIDVVALLAMLALFWAGALTPAEARSGFASNAVLAIVGVMVMGRGLQRAGIPDRMADFILRVAGRERRRIISTVSLSVGTISGFMQNIGAVALFLPVMRGIARREQYPLSSLLMPMGFAALLGGNLTMVGSSSLIVLNDLLQEQGLSTFGLFHVLPIGLVLLGMGIVYFLLLGRFVLPTERKTDEGKASRETLLDVWGLADTLFTCRVTADSPLVGQTVEGGRDWGPLRGQSVEGDCCRRHGPRRRTGHAVSGRAADSGAGTAGRRGPVV